jgi:hypothetical protein
MTAAGKRTTVRGSSTMVIGGCVVFCIVGVLITLGCLLALYLESTGLGAPRDAGMRPGYTTLLIAGAAAGILVPAIVSFVVLRASGRVIMAIAAVTTVILGIAILGIVSI